MLYFLLGACYDDCIILDLLISTGLSSYNLFIIYCFLYFSTANLTFFFYARLIFSD